jgi:predicted metal-binding protein
MRSEPSRDMKQIESILKKFEFRDYAWINPQKIVVSQWVRMKCMFGCEEYGGASCPPNVPSVDLCQRFFAEYKNAVIFHFEKILEDPTDHKEWAKPINSKLLEAERAVFLAGYHKAFVTFMSTCNFCKECAKTKFQCENPHLGRPTPEALAVDVFATVKQYGFPIKVLKDYSERLNRYAFLLVE